MRSTRTGQVHNSDNLFGLGYGFDHAGPPSYYLGNNYTLAPTNSDKNELWNMGCATFIDECVRRIEKEKMFGVNGILIPHHTPLPQEVQQEMDESPLLD
mmetsp:Transcript_4710/g.7296  ORF Transcript_4710/g.7296 Transcript_4710/m.7296 type:complete len:99 (-) Transcript_4710:963-1259(-)